MNNSLYAYRISAIEGCSQVDVLLACYDAVAEDIRLAGSATERGEIDLRCQYTQHALLILGHLESWLSLLESSILGESLTVFYAYVRRELLRLQASPHSEEFADLAMRVCETRAAWQKKKSILVSESVSGLEVQPSRGDDTRLYCSA